MAVFFSILEVSAFASGISAFSKTKKSLKAPVKRASPSPENIPRITWSWNLMGRHLPCNRSIETNISHSTRSRQRMSRRYLPGCFAIFACFCRCIHKLSVRNADAFGVSQTFSLLYRCRIADL